MGIGNIMGIVGGVSLICTLVVMLVGAVYVAVAIEPTYVRAVSSHIENAYELNTPDAMKEEITLAIQGMRELGLENNMYSTLLPWDKTPKTRMDFQYTYLANLNSRIDSVISWKATVYDEQKGVETLGDVYEQKMDNLREFIMEGGRSDWIAHDAYYVNKQTFFAVLEYILAVSFIGSVFLFSLGKMLSNGEERCGLLLREER